jgi:hypothetical protein
MTGAADLLATPPEIEYLETFAAKLPHAGSALLPQGVFGAEGANDESPPRR